MTTQLQSARAGQTTEQLRYVAEREHLAEGLIRDEVAAGRVVIPANRLHIETNLEPIGIGRKLRTKVNANIGASSVKSTISDEIKKLNAALAAGADTVIGITGSELTGTELVSFSRNSDLEDALDMLCDQGLDFAIVEGFKESSLPKVVLGGLQGVSNVIFRVPEDIDMHEELTNSLVEIALIQPDRYTLEALIKKARSDPLIKKAGAIGTFTGIVREVNENERTSNSKPV